jgi:hypothetical protein
MSGAKSYEPFLHVERAELARLNGDESSLERELCEAHRLFLEIGAPIRAAQVTSGFWLGRTIGAEPPRLRQRRSQGTALRRDDECTCGLSSREALPQVTLRSQMAHAPEGKNPRLFPHRKRIAPAPTFGSHCPIRRECRRGPLTAPRAASSSAPRE